MLWQTLKSLIRRDCDADADTMAAQVLSLIREKRAEEAKTLLLSNIKADNPEPELLALMGEVEYHLNHPREAEQRCLEALRLEPGLAGAHYVLSLVYYEAGKNEEALAQAQYAKNCAPSEARILAQLGLCCIALHRFSHGKEALRQAALLDPENVPVLNNLGICLHAMSEFDKALYYFQRAIALNPEYSPAKENLKLLFGIESFSSHFDSQTNVLQTRIEGLESAGQFYSRDEEARAAEELEEDFDICPDDVDVAARLIRHYLKSLNLEAARDVLHLALVHNPIAAPLLILAGRLAHILGQKNRARVNYEQVLEIEPENIEGLLGYGQVLRDLKLLNDALIPFEKAVSIEESSNTLTHLAFAQVNACHYEEALATCDRVEQIYPNLGPVLIGSRAVSHAYLGHFEMAMRYLDEARDLDSQTSSFTVFRGMLNLQHENYKDGWEGYRYRALSSDNIRLLPYPEWCGEDLHGKTILVLAEQGLGDQVMFASCLPDLLARQPKEVVLEANSRVEKTLTRSFPRIRVYPSGQRGFDWLPKELTPDYYIPIADLARHFRHGKKDFPEHAGYLHADPQRVAYWKDRLDRENGRPKIGFTWRGGLQETRQKVRTLKLEELEGVLSDSRFQFVNLQYGPVQQELTEFAREQGLTILDWPEAIQDLDEFSALISALDLVITVCNTTVHYTGALGRPCWVMTPLVPEWRYGTDSPRMRWYPSTRMFRQKEMGNWTEVLVSVVKSLDEYFALPQNSTSESGTNLA